MPLTIDADLDKPAWFAAPWSEDYTDIEGDTRTRPRYRTRSKMLWDDNYLYFAASLDEPHLWATLTTHDSIVYHDNDWEIFLSPTGDNHNYYELEVNALGTIFDLFLPKPYRDGGPADHDWNAMGLRRAIRLRGTLNDPRDVDQGWDIEIAWPWSAFDRHGQSPPKPPRVGDQWRANFSRVQWDVDVVDGHYRKVAGRPEHNWVWSPQGVIDMHRPELWGIVHFADEHGAMPAARPIVTPAYELLHRVYYAQRAYRDAFARWAQTTTDLVAFRPDLTSHIALLDLVPMPNGWRARAIEPCAPNVTLEIDHESRVQSSIQTRYTDRHSLASRSFP